MKKKLIATMVAGVVLSSCFIGLSACGNSVSLPKGEAVADENAWKTAFERTGDLTNYTLEVSTEANQKVEGTVNTNYYDSEVKNKELNFTSESSGYGLILIDADNDKAYSETTYSAEAKGTLRGEEEDSSESSTYMTYYELSEKKDGYKTYWRARYNKSESKSTTGKESEENYWQAEETSYFESSALSSFNIKFSEGKDSEEEKSLYELYDKFTYSSGVYSAELYMETRIGNTAYDNIKCEVKVSFSDGYVIGISYKADKVTDTLYQKGMYDIKYTYSVEFVCALTEIKTTDVSKKVNKDITKAIQKVKDEKEDD